MGIMDRCCNLCTHTKENPCLDYIKCRTGTPVCHSNEKCETKRIEARNRLIYGEDGIRIKVGMSTCGLAAGAKDVFKSLKTVVRKRGLRPRLVAVGCIGSCYSEVLVEVARRGSPAAIYSGVRPKDVDYILGRYLADDVRGAFALRSKNGTMNGEEDVPLLNELDWFKYQVRNVIENCGVIDPESIEEYIISGGYLALSRVLKDMTSGDVIKEVTDSRLRGRGGAGFPTGLKWELCHKVDATRRYIICNADEGDPGAFMNRLIAEGDPHKILEGLIIAAYATGASTGYIFVRAEKPLMAKRLSTAVEQAKLHTLLGPNILGSEFSLDIETMLGAGAFVCGEETALMACIEGRRAMPRSRPPFPATKGLWDSPTTINNVETLAHIPNIIKDGVKEFVKFGTENSKGTKVFCLAGKIVRGGAVEVPLGTSVKSLIYELGGGIQGNKKLKAVQTGGPGGGCLSREHLDLPLDFETLQEAGSIMGSGGIIIVDEDTCIVDLTKYFLTFTKAESCGKCTPCREGTKRLLDILTKITDGRGELIDLERLTNLSEVVAESSLCALGRIAPNPILTTLQHFQEEYIAHILERHCPANVCSKYVDYKVIPELCTGCGLCVKECPSEAVKLDLQMKAVIDQEKCVKCGHCFAICPSRSIQKL